MENIPYDISCSKATFDSIKTDERFLNLLTFARFINALRFCHKAGIDAKDLVGPSGARSCINSFFFSASILYEGFILVEKVTKSFKDRESFRNGFSVLMRDRKVKDLRKRLNPMRNQSVFHFDKQVSKKSLENFELPEYKFATGIGNAAGEMVFSLADEVVINYLLQPAPGETDNSLKERLNKIIEDTNEITGKFLEAAERLMADVLKDMGFKVRINSDRQVPKVG